MLRVLNRLDVKCPTCGLAMLPAKNIDGTDSTFWLKCCSPKCNTYVDTYIPQEHQEFIHKDTHKYLGVFGGYGSGKTQCTLKDDEKHMLSNPNGMTVVGSAVLSQVEQTYEKDFRKDFPAAFIKTENKSKKTYTLVNGHELLIKTLYDEELIRSMNATRIHIVEASAVDHELFVQLQARLRNFIAVKLEKDEKGNPVWDASKHTFKFSADWRKCLVESNPSVGWIRDNFLLESDYINTDYCNQTYDVPKPNKNYASYIFPTKLNKFLPEGFEENLANNKPAWWINRYLNGSFDYAEGMVYTNVMKAMIQSFKVPESWVRYMAMDYGINDPTAFIFLAIDPDNHVAYVIGEAYNNNRDYKEQSAIYWDAHKTYVPLNNYYKTPVMDGRSINKRNDANLKTIGDLFREEGLFFNAAKMDLNTRLLKVNTLINSGKLKIFRDKCPNLYKEMVNYKFPERTADGKSKGDKPVDKNNHATNALEFACMELPDDMVLKDLQAYNAEGHIMVPEAYQKSSRKEDPNKKQPNPYYFDPFKDDNRDRGRGFENIFNDIGGIPSW